MNRRSSNTDRELVDHVCAALVDRGAFALVVEIAGRHGLSPLDLAGRDPSPHVARARREAWAVMAARYRLSTTELGRIWGRDPTSIASGLRKLREEAGRLQPRARGAGLGEASSPAAGDDTPAERAGA